LKVAVRRTKVHGRKSKHKANSLHIHNKSSPVTDSHLLCQLPDNFSISESLRLQKSGKVITKEGITAPEPIKFNNRWV